MTLDAIAESQLLTETSETTLYLVPHVVLRYTRPIDDAVFLSAFKKACLHDASPLNFKLVKQDRCWSWAYDKADLDKHVMPTERFGTGDSFNQFISSLMSTGLPVSRPPWEVGLFEVEGASVCVFRFHHALGDGASMIRQLLHTSATSSSRDQHYDFPINHGLKTLTTLSSASSPRQSWYRRIVAVCSTIYNILSEPADSPNSPLRFRKPSRPTNPIPFASTSPTTTQPAIASFEFPIPLSELKPRTKTTVTDFCLGIMQQAIQQSIGDIRDMTAAMWVNLGPSENANLGNANLAVTYIPLSTERGQTREPSKVRAEAAITQLLLIGFVNTRRLIIKTMGIVFMPRSVVEYVLKWMHWMFVKITDKASVSVSSIRGPSVPVKWPLGLDADISRFEVFTPCLMRMGFMVNFVSYNNKMNLCVTSETLDTEQLHNFIKTFERVLFKALNTE